MIFSLFKVTIGWAIVSYLVYYYVVLQSGLIASVWLMAVVTIVGLAFSFLFSSTEMALAECTQEDFRKLELRAKEIENEAKKNSTSFNEVYYRREVKKLLKVKEIYNNSAAYNPAIVVGNNVANVAVATMLPMALTSEPPQDGSIKFVFGEEGVLSFIGLPVYGMPFPGTETLTFFSVLLLIIIFGEIIPKRLAQNDPLRFIETFYRAYVVSKFMFGWLGDAFAALLHPINLIRKIGLALKAKP